MGIPARRNSVLEIPNLTTRGIASGVTVALTTSVPTVVAVSTFALAVLC